MIILEKGERADQLWGMNTEIITDEMIEALEQGKRLYLTGNDEYAVVIKKDGKRKAGKPEAIDTDTISRQAVLDAIFSEPLYESGMKKRDSDIIVPAIYEKIKALPSSPSIEPDPDTVSRQAARDAVCEELDSIDHVPQWVFDRLTKKIENLPPSPTPSRPHGKWIGGGDYPRVCSVCGEEWDQYVSGTIWYDGVPDFCPSCGADMRQDGGAV